MEEGEKIRLKTEDLSSNELIELVNLVLLCAKENQRKEICCSVSCSRKLIPLSCSDKSFLSQDGECNMSSLSLCYRF